MTSSQKGMSRVAVNSSSARLTSTKPQTEREKDNMATKKNVKVKDLKPSKDAKGGAARQTQGSSRNLQGHTRNTQGNTRNTQGSTRNLN
jgi:hypothetical protein